MYISRREKRNTFFLCRRKNRRKKNCQACIDQFLCSLTSCLTSHSTSFSSFSSFLVKSSFFLLFHKIMVGDGKCGVVLSDHITIFFVFLLNVLPAVVRMFQLDTNYISRDISFISSLLFLPFSCE